MKITVIKEDWPGANYVDPCGCLLARALRRKMGHLVQFKVYPAGVLIEARYYRIEKEESRALFRAHHDPKLLPLTITLKP
jgi:hypothetical protein